MENSKKYKFAEDEVKEIIKLYEIDRIPCQKIADKVNSTFAVIYKLLQRNGISTKSRQYATPDLQNKIVQLYQQGLSTREVATQIGGTQGGVMSVLERLNIPRRESGYFNWDRTYKMNEAFFANGIYDEKTAYVLGVFYAKGSLWLKKSNFKYSFTYADENECKKIVGLLESDLPVKPFGGSFQVNFASKAFCETLSSVGIMENKCESNILPIGLVSDSLMRHFIRGYFDFSNSIRQRWNRPSYTVTIWGNYDFLSSLNNYLTDKLLLKTTLGVKQGCYLLNLYKAETIEGFCNFIYSDFTLFCKSNYNILSQYLKSLEDKKRAMFTYNEHGVLIEKRCYKCMVKKPLSEYGKNKSKSDGLGCECKECKAAADLAAQLKRIKTPKGKVRF